MVCTFQQTSLGKPPGLFVVFLQNDTWAESASSTIVYISQEQERVQILAFALQKLGRNQIYVVSKSQAEVNRCE